MAVQSLVITSTSTPTAVAGTFSGDSQHGYIRVRLRSLSGTVYFGDSGVTTDGYPLTSAEASIQETLLTGETLWVCSSGAASVAVLRTNETS